MSEQEAQVTIALVTSADGPTASTVTTSVVRSSDHGSPPPVIVTSSTASTATNQSSPQPNQSNVLNVKTRVVPVARADEDYAPSRRSKKRSSHPAKSSADSNMPARPRPYKQRPAAAARTSAVDQDGEWSKFEEGGETRYRCELCGKIFNNRSNLLRHLPNHWDKKPYECADCGRAFPRRGQLMQHIRSHQDDFPFKCSTCGKSFKWKQSLRRHHCHQNYTPLPRENHHHKNQIATAPPPNARYLQSAIPV